MSIRTLAVAVTAALLLAASEKPAASDGGLPIRVDIDYDLPAMTAGWTPAQRDEISTQIRTALIEDMKGAYPYYEFTETDGSPSPKLVFRTVNSKKLCV